MPLRLSEANYKRLKAGQPLKGDNKFGAIKDTVDGVVFHSRFEASVWRGLRLRARAGDILNLRRQVPYRFVVQGHLICTFKADFVYDEVDRQGFYRTIVLDAKSPATRREPTYRIKVKLLKALYDVTIREVMQDRR